MPAKENKSISQAKARAFAYVSEKIQNLDGCPVCKGNHWQISDSVFTMNEVNALGLTGNVFPVIPAICANCGNVLLFSAQDAGVTDSWHFQKGDSDAE